MRSRLMALGLNIRRAVCVSADVYLRYVATTGLRERILLEAKPEIFPGYALGRNRTNAAATIM